MLDLRCEKHRKFDISLHLNKSRANVDGVDLKSNILYLKSIIKSA
jgi:hypothetical protein